MRLFYAIGFLWILRQDSSGRNTILWGFLQSSPIIGTPPEVTYRNSSRALLETPPELSQYISHSREDEREGISQEAERWREARRQTLTRHQDSRRIQQHHHHREVRRHKKQTAKRIAPSKQSPPRRRTYVACAEGKESGGEQAKAEREQKEREGAESACPLAPVPTGQHGAHASA